MAQPEGKYLRDGRRICDGCLSIDEVYKWVAVRQARVGLVLQNELNDVTAKDWCYRCSKKEG